MDITEASKRLGVSSRTVTRWCQSGKLSAVTQSYGTKTTYLVSVAAIEEVNKPQQKSEPILSVPPEKPPQSHGPLYESWVIAMESGLLTGRAFSQRTVDDYKFYVRGFLDKGLEVSIETLKAELVAIPTAQIAKRQHCYKALVCFGKYLVTEGMLSVEFIEKAKPFYPKRHIPPKRSSITEAEFTQLLAACTEAQERLIVTLLSHTGIRASEACALYWKDIDLEKRCLRIRHGKGGKPRVVGLTPMAAAAITHFQDTSGKGDYMLIDRNGRPMTRNGLYQRLERIGTKAGVKVSPHALRRAFVTLNANKGRPLQMLQKACGHSNIKTTMSYCRTTEQEVIEAMQGWD